MNELARTLRDLARRWGVSEEYIAEFTGLDRSYIRRLFSGEKRNPSRRVLVAVALALVSCPERYRKDKERMVNAFPALLAAALEDALEPSNR